MGNPGQDGAGQLEGRVELDWAVSQLTWKVLSCEVRGNAIPCVWDRDGGFCLPAASPLSPQGRAGSLVLATAYIS